MVRRRVDAAQTVHSGREASGDIHIQVAVSVKRSVDPLEEGELGVVEGSGLRQALERLDNEVRMALNGVRCVKLLGRRVVVRLSVGEVAVYEMRNSSETTAKSRLTRRSGF